MQQERRHDKAGNPIPNVVTGSKGENQVLILLSWGTEKKILRFKGILEYK